MNWNGKVSVAKCRGLRLLFWHENLDIIDA